MVTFQCEQCITTLKKKQIEKHYSFECRGAHIFSCLTCWKNFDRSTIKDHISCVTEQEKYQKGDQVNTKNKINGNAIKNIEVKTDFSDLNWNGLRKTSKNILKHSQNHKLPIGDLLSHMIKIYAKHKNVSGEEVDTDLMRKQLLKKLQSDDKFVLDLSKHTLRYKF
jgi:hypothetical protein